jgi:hypothetical protein
MDKMVKISSFPQDKEIVYSNKPLKSRHYTNLAHKLLAIPHSRELTLTLEKGDRLDQL